MPRLPGCHACWGLDCAHRGHHWWPAATSEYGGLVRGCPWWDRRSPGCTAGSWPPCTGDRPPSRPCPARGARTWPALCTPRPAGCGISTCPCSAPPGAPVSTPRCCPLPMTRSPNRESMRPRGPRRACARRLRGSAPGRLAVGGSPHGGSHPERRAAADGAPTGRAPQRPPCASCTRSPSWGADYTLLRPGTRFVDLGADVTLCGPCRQLAWTSIGRWTLDIVSVSFCRFLTLRVCRYFS